MAWKTIERAAHAAPQQILTHPVRLWNNSSPRLLLSKKWLLSIGKENAKTLTLLYDEKQKTIGMTFLENDFINGYKLSSYRTGSNFVAVNSKAGVKRAMEFGYKPSRPLTVKQDADDPNIWVIQKEE